MVINPIDHDRLEGMIREARSIMRSPEQNENSSVSRVQKLFDLRLTAYKHGTESGNRFDEGVSDIYVGPRSARSNEGEFFDHVSSDVLAVKGNKANIQTVQFTTWIGLRMILGGHEQIPEILQAAHKPFGGAEGEAPNPEELGQVISELMVRIVIVNQEKKAWCDLKESEFVRLSALVDFAKQNRIELQFTEDVITKLCVSFGRSMVRRDLSGNGDTKVATYYTLLGELEKTRGAEDIKTLMKEVLIESLGGENDRLCTDGGDLDPQLLFTIARERGIVFSEIDIARMEEKYGHMMNNGQRSFFQVWRNQLFFSMRKSSEVEGNPKLSPERAIRSAAIERLTEAVNSSDMRRRSPNNIMMLLWDSCSFKHAEELGLNMDTIDVEGLIAEVMKKAFAEKPAEVTWLMQVFSHIMNRSFVEIKGDRLDDLMVELNIQVQEDPQPC